MKKNIKLISMTIWTMLTLSACQDIFLTDDKPISLSASGVAVVTRAGTSIQGSSFDPQTRINVYITNHNNSNDIIGDPTVFEAAAESNGINNLTPINGQPYYPSGIGSQVDIFALYPPSKATKNASSFSVEPNQVSDANYKLSDLMCVPSFTQSKTSETVHLGFTHKMAKLIITVSPETDIDGNALYDITGVTLKSVKRTIGFNPSTGGLGELDNDTREEYTTIELENGGAVLFPPQTITANPFIVIHTRKKSDNSVGDAEFGIENKEFEQGKEYSLNLAVGTDNIGKNDYTISGWDENSGEVTVAPNGGEDGLQATLDKETWTYTGKEITPTPTVTFGTENKKELSIANGDYTVQYVDNIDVGTGQVLITGQGFYAGLIIVKSFKITQAAGSISYPIPTYGEVPYTIGGTIENNDLEQTGDGEVTYTSSQPSSVYVDSNTGAVSILGVSEGSVTIRATVTDSRNWHYETTQATYTLTVTGRNASNFHVVLSPTSYTYDGTEHQPTVTVYDSADLNTPLTEGNYSVTFLDDKISYLEGGQRVKVSGEGNYASNTYTIKTYTINKATPSIHVDDLSDMIIGVNSIEVSRTKTRTASTNTWAVNSLTFRSSNESVATAVVNSAKNGGTVTGVAGGAHDGEGTNTTYGTEVTCSVYVAPSQNWNQSEIKTFKVTVVKADFPFDYTGRTKKWVCPADGRYKLEVWGAQGGDVPSSYSNRSYGGKGAYVSGELNLTKGNVLFVNVGQKGITLTTGTSHTVNTSATYTNGQGWNSAAFYADGRAWNGGGYAVWGMRWGQFGSDTGTYINGIAVKDPICGGGGATDIALSGVDDSNTWNTTQHLYTRILVAGGGGGALYYSNEGAGAGNGGDGGAWNGEVGQSNDPGEGAYIYRPGIGAYTTSSLGNNGNTLRNRGTAQTSAYDGRGGGYAGADGVIGEGGFYWCINEGAGCGGGGWFGGGSGGQHNINGSGGGGSSYAWTEEIEVKDANNTNRKLSYYYTLDFSSYKSNQTTVSSNVQNPNQQNYQKLSNVSVTSGVRSGNGYATITALTISD